MFPFRNISVQESAVFDNWVILWRLYVSQFNRDEKTRCCGLMHKAAEHHIDLLSLPLSLLLSDKNCLLRQNKERNNSIVKLIYILKIVMHKTIAHHWTDAQTVPEQWLFSQTKSSNFYSFFAWHHMVWDILLASLGQLSCLYLLPVLSAPSVPLLAGQHKKLRNWKVLDSLCCSATIKIWVCYQHFFSDSQKHRSSRNYEEKELCSSWN